MILSRAESHCRMYFTVSVLVLACQLLSRPVRGYQPVIVMHGILSSSLSMDTMVNFIKSAHSGTEVLNVDLFNDLESVNNNMWKQVDGVRENIQSLFDRSPDGVNMVCYSQGGLICRGILEMFDEANVNTFIALSSPLAGQYGDTEFLQFLFPNYTKEHIYELFYTEVGQRDISVANYWNDPEHQALYHLYDNFLPYLNNGSYPAKNFKKNFLNLKQLVLIGGPNDGVITPWQSSQFGFYDEKMNIVPMTSQSFYEEDLFGLRTLDKEGRVKAYTIPKVEHLHWPKDKSVFDCCIEPWLK